MKRIISLILIAVMCICTVPAVSAARDVSFEEGLAGDLKSLGIFKGVSDTNFDLNRAPTRIEALVMLIRLLGKDKAATTGNWSHPFNDVPDWADGYVGYAYENGLTNGVSKTEFGTGNATIQMFLTFVLRSLGYSDKNGGDFSYSEPFSFAYNAGILPGCVNRENFLRADVVIVSYAALAAYMNKSDNTLAQKLISENVFTQKAYSSYYDSGAISNHEASQSTRELSAEEIFAACSPGVFYIEVYDAYGRGLATGSGFFIDSDGTAVTNYHVIDGAHSAKIRVGESETVYDVEFVYDFNEEEDWAVIQIDGSNFDYLERGDGASVIGGATVYALGSPLGLHNTISQGIISNVNRVVDGISFIQTSAPISSGSSGGALINKYGEVIGITSAKFSEGENLGLAIPISIIDKCDYSNHMTLAQVASGLGFDVNTNLSGRDALIDFSVKYVEKNCEYEYDDGSLGAVLDEYYTDGGVLVEAVLAVHPQTHAVSVIVYGGDYSGEFYEEIYFSDPADSMRCFYEYESIMNPWDNFVGASYLNARRYVSGNIVGFDEVDTPNRPGSSQDVHVDLHSVCIDIAVDYISDLVDIASFTGYNVTMSDLGFLRY